VGVLSMYCVYFVAFVFVALCVMLVGGGVLLVLKDRMLLDEF
jgi:hypothetical protein